MLADNEKEKKLHIYRWRRQYGRSLNIQIPFLHLTSKLAFSGHSSNVGGLNSRGEARTAPVLEHRTGTTHPTIVPRAPCL